MKRTFLFLVLLLSLSMVRGETPPKILLMEIHGHPLQVEFSVPRSVASTLPKWSVSSDEPPLSLQAAVKIAKQHLRKSQPDVIAWQPFRVVLMTTPAGEMDHVWFYEIGLYEWKDDKPARMGNSVVVLMDGSVLEPIILK